MFCKKCGAAVKDGEKTCPHCGCPLTDVRESGTARGVEYVPGFLRKPWTILYTWVDQTFRMKPRKTAETPYNEKAIRKNTLNYLRWHKFHVVEWIFLLYYGLYVVGSLAAVLQGQINALQVLATFVYIYCLLACVLPVYVLRVKAKPETVEQEGVANIMIPAFIILAILPAQLILSLVFGMFKEALRALGMAVLYMVVVTVVPLLWRGDLYHDAMIGLENEKKYPGWLAIFRTSGEARGAEGERYVDANLDIWCAGHPGFFTVKKDCVSQYSTSCIRLGLQGFPTGPQEYDHILVGPGLVIHIETKAYGGSMRVVSPEQWNRWNKGSKCWEALASPNVQAERHDVLMRELIRDRAVIVPLICMADASAKLEYAGDSGSVEIVGITQLQRRLSELTMFYAEDAQNVGSTAWELSAMLDNAKVNRKTI